MKIKFWFAMAAVMMASAAVQASDESLRASYQRCMDRASTTADMHDCSNTEMKYQDTRLNKAYQKAMKSLDQKRAQELQNLQRLWIRYRDAKCNFYNVPDGGSIVGLNVGGCLLTETTRRADELEWITEEGSGF